MSSTDVRVRLPEGAPAAAYALDVLLGLLGVGARPATRDADLVYGEGPGRCRIPAGPADGWDDPRPCVVRDGGLALLHRPGGPARRRAGPGALGFDALYATYALLTGPWEVVDPVDVVGCPIAAEGWLGRNGLLKEPLVHRYAGVLAGALSEAGMPCSPPHRPGIVLTHDVDDNFRHLFGRRERWERFRRELRERRPSAVRRAAGFVREATRRGPDPNDRFDDWRDWHRRWRSTPTFFVASFGLFHPESAERDVAYDIRHPEVAAMIRRMRDEGAHIGVHFSIGARESSERLRREREAVEKVVGGSVPLARHHWWALGVPAEATLRLHADAGVKLDCSLGFNDRAGFRRGIAAPFRPFEPETKRALPVWTLPTTALDAALFDGRRSHEEAVLELRSLLETVRGIGGALVLDWHVHSANPSALPGAADGLHRFLDDATGEGTVLRTPLELLADCQGR